MIIHTKNLVLLPLSVETAAAIIAGDLSSLKVGDGWPHADTLDGIGGVAHGSEAWLVTLDGVVIGDCGTHGPADEAGEIEIGYGIASPYRGSGYGNEIAASLSRYLMERGDVTRVVANEVLAINIPSRRALENAGFEIVNELDDLVWYRLTK